MFFGHVLYAQYPNSGVNLSALNLIDQSRGMKKMSIRLRVTNSKTYRVSLRDLVRNLIGVEVLGFDKSDQEFLKLLQDSANTLLNEYGETGINEFVGKRPNDISDNTDEGLSLEEELVRYINNVSEESELHFKARRLTPRMGYPNICVVRNNDIYCYADVKVTSRVVRGSARDIYLSPGPITGMSTEIVGEELGLSFTVRKGNIYKKIRSSARHIILLFRAERIGEKIVRNIRSGRWKIRNCEIFDISDLSMKIKIEFNASFRDLDRCRRSWSI